MYNQDFNKVIPTLFRHIRSIAGPKWWLSLKATYYVRQLSWISLPVQLFSIAATGEVWQFQQKPIDNI